MSKYDVPDDTLTEIMVDNFAGGGGASTGISMAMGREIDIAINHNAEALDMHARNHPSTKHYCESVFDVDPKEATKGRPVGLMWMSPDCRHHSRAKGGKPRDQGIRGLAWIALRWAVEVSPRLTIAENVSEICQWGPLNEDGFPIKERAGETFQAFVLAMSTGLSPDHPAIPEIVAALGEKFPLDRIYKGLGYKVEYKELKACDYGAPTIRKRLFLVARRDGLPIVWPEPTHGDPKKKGFAASGLKPWLTAAQCIDWSEPTRSIFDRKKPLAVNTMRRVAKGIKKFVLDSPNPFIVSLAHGEESPSGVKRWGSGVRDINLPLQTVLASGNGASVVQPFLAKFRGDSAGAPLDSPMPTITSGGDAKRPAGSPHALGLVEASMSPFLTEHAQSSSQRCFAANEPLRTVCANVKGGHFSVVVPTLIQTGYGERAGQEPRALDIEQPLGTIVAGGAKHALVSASLTTFYGDKSVNGDGRGAPLDEPLRTQTTESRHGLVLASITKFRQDSPGSELSEPLDTVAASGQHHGLLKIAAVHMEQANGGGYSGEGRSISEPVSTILGSGSHQQLVISDLASPEEEKANHRRDQVRAFAKEYLGLDKLLVVVEGFLYEIVEIGLRMLMPIELFKAQGFPDGYIIEFKRNGKNLSKSAQVRLCGNSVAPPVAEALVRANMSQSFKQLKKAA
jgi:DNA (cytosine-5)-methyltransferase 1